MKTYLTEPYNEQDTEDLVAIAAITARVVNHFLLDAMVYGDQRVVLPTNFYVVLARAVGALYVMSIRLGKIDEQGEQHQANVKKWEDGGLEAAGVRLGEIILKQAVSSGVTPEKIEQVMNAMTAAVQELAEEARQEQQAQQQQAVEDLLKDWLMELGDKPTDPSKLN